MGREERTCRMDLGDSNRIKGNPTDLEHFWDKALSTFKAACERKQETKRMKERRESLADASQEKPSGGAATRQGFVTLPGVRLAYEIAGRGAPIVFLHGGLLDRRMWDGQFSFFAQRYQSIRYDMRSSGQSETTPSTELYAHHEDLFSLLQALQLQCVSLVGLSNYAIGLDFAVAYPTLVHKLVLVSPGLRGYKFRDPWLGTHFTAMLRALQQRDLTVAVEAFLTMWVDGPHRSPAQVDSIVRDRAREMVAQAFPLSRLAPFSQGLEPPAMGRLSDVRAPTLIVLGEKDAPEIHTIGSWIHDHVSGSKLVTIPDVGHTLVMEKPAEFNMLVDNFLRA